LITTWTDIVVITSSSANVTTTATTTSYTPVPTNTQLGLNWYYYTSTYAFQGTIPFSAQEFNSTNYNFSGYIENVNEFHTSVTYSTSSTNYTCNAPVPANEDCGYVVVIFQGYLWARDGPGNYVLSSSDASDNAFLVWHGSNAYSNYQNSNYDYQATYPSTSGSVTIDVGTDALVPITMLWGNGGGPGQVVLTITNPAGTTYSNTTGFFVPANSTCPGYIDPFSP
jgi:GLEYA domain